MKRILTATLFAALFVLISPALAQAHPGHTSCRGFGEVVAAEGKAQVIAPELRAIGPGNIDDVVRLVHLGGEFFGEEVPALCTT